MSQYNKVNSKSLNQLIKILNKMIKTHNFHIIVLNTLISILT